MNTVNWALWLVLAMGYCTLTYNPAYQVLLFAAVSAVAVSKGQPLLAYVKTGLLVSAIPLFVNVFLVHNGKAVIFNVPYSLKVVGLNVPTLFFAGPMTVESVIMGAVMVVFIVNMLAAFQVFNSVTSADLVLRLIPSSVSAVGLAAAVGLRFIPTVLRDHASIRDAQASRGVRLDAGNVAERIRNNASTITPTIITSLERGFSLAESMAARGYSGERTAYVKEVWSWKERAKAAALIGAACVALYCAWAGLLTYWPYDSAVIPPVSAAAVIPLIALLIPVVE
jgi:energy-coupling factor transport system permease protein